MNASEYVKTGETITVAALIKELQQYPPETPVIVGADDVPWTCPGSVFSPANVPAGNCGWGDDFDDAVVTIVGDRYIGAGS